MFELLFWLVVLYLIIGILVAVVNVPTEGWSRLGIVLKWPSYLMAKRVEPDDG